MNLNSLEEHSWIVKRLNAIDPQKRRWYISARESGGSWVNEDGSQLVNLDQAFLPDQPFSSLTSRNPYLVYRSGTRVQK